jgi:hypothetical protein
VEEVKFNLLLALAEKSTSQARPNIDPVLFADLHQIGDYYLSQVLTNEGASEIFKANLQTAEPITCISGILNFDQMQMCPNVAAIPPALPDLHTKTSVYGVCMKIIIFSLQYTRIGWTTGLWFLDLLEMEEPEFIALSAGAMLSIPAY